MGNSQKSGKTGKVIIYRGQVSELLTFPTYTTNGLSEHVSLHFPLISLHEFAIRLKAPSSAPLIRKIHLCD